jgi:NADPH:quinone reductase-like Zn-dependent oxidoreductase
VTSVDSPEKLKFIRSLGANQVIDYTKGDYTHAGESYDLIIDVVGKGSVAHRLKLLKSDGYYFLAYAELSHILLAMWVSMTSNKKLKIESSSQKKEDLIFLKELIEAGKVKPVIDSSYPLEQTVDAHKYVETGRKKGNIVITMA